MAYGPKTGVKSVSTAGTRVRLVSDPSYTEAVAIIADEDNSGDIYIGGDDVSSSNGIILAASKSVSLSAPSSRAGDEGLNLKEIYIDSAQNGDGVRFVYYKKVSN